MHFQLAWHVALLGSHALHRLSQSRPLVFSRNGVSELGLSWILVINSHCGRLQALTLRQVPGSAVRALLRRYTLLHSEGSLIRNFLVLFLWLLFNFLHSVKHGAESSLLSEQLV